MAQPIHVPAMLGGDIAKKSSTLKLDNKTNTRVTPANNTSNLLQTKTPLAAATESSALEHSLKDTSHVSSHLSEISDTTVMEEQKSWANSAIPVKHICSVFAANMYLLGRGIPVFYQYSVTNLIPAYLLTLSPRTMQAMIRVPSAYTFELVDIFITVPLTALALIPHFRPEGLLSHLGTLAYAAYLGGSDSMATDLFVQALSSVPSEKLSAGIEAAWKVIRQALQTAETNLTMKYLTPTRYSDQFLGALSGPELSRLGVADHSIKEWTDTEATEASGILNVEYSDIVSEVSMSVSGFSAKCNSKKSNYIQIDNLYFSVHNSLFKHISYTCLDSLVDKEIAHFSSVLNVQALRAELLGTLRKEFLLSLTAVKNTLDVGTTKNAFICDAIVSSSGLSKFRESTRNHLIDTGVLYQKLDGNRDALMKELENNFKVTLNRSTSGRTQKFKECHAALNATIKFQSLFHSILNKYLGVILPELKLFVLSLGTIKAARVLTLVESLTRIFSFLEDNALKPLSGSIPFYNIVVLLDDLRKDMINIAVMYLECLTPKVCLALLRLGLGSRLYDNITRSISTTSESKIMAHIFDLFRDKQLPVRKAEFVEQLQKALPVMKKKHAIKGLKLKTAQFYTRLNKFLIERVLSLLGCIMYEEYIRVKNIKGIQSSGEYPSIKVYMHFVRILVKICIEEYTDASLKWHTDIVERMDVMKNRSNRASAHSITAHRPQNPLQADSTPASPLLRDLEALGLFITDEEADTVANILMIELDLIADLNANKTDIVGLYTDPSPEQIVSSLRDLFFDVLENSNHLHISIEAFFKNYVCNGIILRDDLTFSLNSIGEQQIISEYKMLEGQIFSHAASASLSKIISDTLNKTNQTMQLQKMTLVNIIGWKSTQEDTLDSAKTHSRSKPDNTNIGQEIFLQYGGLLSEEEMLEFVQLDEATRKQIVSLLAQRKTLLSSWAETMFHYQMKHENEQYQKISLNQQDIFGFRPFLDMCSECDRKISVSPAPEPIKELSEELFDSLIGLIKLTCDVLIEEIGLKELWKLAEKTVLLQSYPVLDDPEPTGLPPQAIFNLDIANYNLLFLLKDSSPNNDPREKPPVQESKDSLESSVPPRILSFAELELLLRQKPPFLLKIVHNATTLVSKIDYFLLMQFVGLPTYIGNEVIKFNTTNFKKSVVAAMHSLRSMVVSHVHNAMEALMNHSLKIVVMTESIMGQTPKSPDDLALMIDNLGRYDNFMKTWVPVGLLLIDLLIDMSRLSDGYLSFVSLGSAENTPEIPCEWGSFSMSFMLENNSFHQASADSCSTVLDRRKSITKQHSSSSNPSDTWTSQDTDILPPLPKELLCLHGDSSVGGLEDDESSTIASVSFTSELLAALSYFNEKPHRSFNVQKLVAKIFQIARLQKLARHIVKSQTRTFARHLLKLSDWISDTATILHEYCKEATRMSYRDIFIARYYPRTFKSTFVFLTRNMNIPFLDDNFEVLDDELVSEFLESTQAYVQGFQMFRPPGERVRLRLTQPSTRATIRSAAVQESLHGINSRIRFCTQYFRPAEHELLPDLFTDKSPLDLEDMSLFMTPDNGTQSNTALSTANPPTSVNRGSDTFSLTSLQAPKSQKTPSEQTSPLGKSVSCLKISDLLIEEDTAERLSPVGGSQSHFYNMFHVFTELLFISDVLYRIHQTALRWAGYLGVTLNLVEDPTKIMGILCPATTIITSLYSIKQRYSALQSMLLKDTDVRDFMTLLSEAAQSIIIGKENPAFKMWKETVQATETDVIRFGPQVFYLHCLSSPNLTTADFKYLAEELSLPITEDREISNAQLLQVSDFGYALQLAQKVFTRAEKNTQALSQLEEISIFLNALQIFPCDLIVYIDLSDELSVLFNRWQNAGTNIEGENDLTQEPQKETDTKQNISKVPDKGKEIKLSLVVPAHQENTSTLNSRVSTLDKPAANPLKNAKGRALSRLGSLKLQVDDNSSTTQLPDNSTINKSDLPGHNTSSNPSIPSSSANISHFRHGTSTPSNMLACQNRTVLPFVRVHTGLLQAVREALFFVADTLARKHPHAVQVRARQLEVQLLLFRSALISINRISMLLPELLYILPRLTIARNGVQDMSFLSLYNEFGDYKKTIFNTLNLLREVNNHAVASSGPGSFMMLITQKPQILSQLAHCTHDLNNILENVYSKVLSIPLIPHYNSKPVACALFLPKIPSIFYSIFSLQESLNVLYYCPAVYQSVLPNFDRVLVGNPRTMTYQRPDPAKRTAQYTLPHLKPSDVIIVGLESGFERLYFEYGLKAPQELFLLSGMLNDMRLQRESLMREHKRAFLLLLSYRFQEFLCQCLYQSVVYALSAIFCLHLNGSVDRFFTLKFTIFGQLKRHLAGPEIHDTLEQKVDYQILFPDYNIPETYINIIRRGLFGLTGPMTNDDEILAKTVETSARIEYYKQRRYQRYLYFKAVAARVFEYDQLLNIIILQTIQYYNSYYLEVEQMYSQASTHSTRKNHKAVKFDPFPPLDMNKPIPLEVIEELKTLFSRVHESERHQPIIAGAGCSINIETNKILSSLTYGVVVSSVMQDEETGELIKPAPTSAGVPTQVMITAEDITARGATRGFGRTAVSISNSVTGTGSAGFGNKGYESQRSTEPTSIVSSSTMFNLDCKLLVGSAATNLGPHYLGKATLLDSLALNHKQLAIVTSILIGSSQRKPVFIYSDKLRGYNILDINIIAQYVSRLFCTRHIFLSLTNYSSADSIVLQIVSYFMAGYGIYLQGFEFLLPEHHARLVDCFNTIYLAQGNFPIVRYQSGGSVPGDLALNDFKTYTFTGYIVIVLPELIYCDDGSMYLSSTGQRISQLFKQTKIEAFLDSFGSGLATSATKLNTLITGALCNLAITLPTGNRQSLASGTRLTNERGDLPSGKPHCKHFAQLYGAILTDFAGMLHFDPVLTKTALKYLPDREAFVPVISNHILYHLFKKRSELYASNFYEISLFLNSMQSACPRLHPDDVEIIYKRARDPKNTFSVAITTVLLLVGQVYSAQIREFLIKVVSSAFHLTGSQVLHINKIVGSLNKLFNLSSDEYSLKKPIGKNFSASRSHIYDAAGADHGARHGQEKLPDSEQEEDQLSDSQTGSDKVTINYAKSPTASLSYNIWMHLKQILSPQYAQICESAAEQAGLVGSLGADMLLTCLEYLQLGPCALFSNNQSIQILSCYATILSKFGRLQPFFIHSLNDLHHHSDTIRRLGASALVILIISDSTGNIGPSLYGSLLAFMNPIPHLSMTNGVELNLEPATMFNASPTSDSIVSKYGRPKILVITTGSFLDDKMLSTPLGLLPRRMVIDSSVMRTSSLLKILILNAFKLSSNTANNILDYIHERMTNYTIDNIVDLSTAQQYFQRMCTPPCTDENSVLQMGLKRLRFISNLFYLLVLQYCEQATTVFSMTLDLRGWRIFRSTFFYYLVCCKVCVFKSPSIRAYTAEQLAGRAIANDLQSFRKTQQFTVSSVSPTSSATVQNASQPIQSPLAKGPLASSSFSTTARDPGTPNQCTTTRGPLTGRIPNTARLDSTAAPTQPITMSQETQNGIKSPAVGDLTKQKLDTNISLMNNLKPPSEFPILAHTAINLSHVWCAEHVGSFSSALAMFGERHFTFFDIALADDFLTEYVYKAESYEQACFNLLCPIFAAVWNSASLTYLQYLGGKPRKLPKMWMKYLNFHSKHTIPLLISRFSNDKVLQKSIEACLVHIEETLPSEYPYEKYKYAYLTVVNETGSYMQYTAENSVSGMMLTKEAKNPILNAGKNKGKTRLPSGYSKPSNSLVPPLATELISKPHLSAPSDGKENSLHYSQLKFLPYSFGKDLMETPQTDKFTKPTSAHELVIYFDMLRSQLIFFIVVCILGGVPVHILGPRYCGKSTLIKAAHTLIQEYSILQLYLPSTCEPNKLFLADAARELYLVNGNELRFPGEQLLHMHFVTLFLDNGKFERMPPNLLEVVTKNACLDIAALFLGERVLLLNSPGNVSISPEGDSHQALLGTADAATISITFESEFCPPQLLCSQLVNVFVPDTSRSFLIELLLTQERYLDISPYTEALLEGPMQKVSLGVNAKSMPKAKNSTANSSSTTNAINIQEIEHLNELSSFWVKQLVDGLLLVKDQISVNILHLLAEAKRLSIFCTNSSSDIQMRIFTASLIFMALRFISEITAPTMIAIIDALRGSLAMGKLSPTGPWGILNAKNIQVFAKSNRLLDSCGATKLQFELSWESEALRIAQEQCKILDTSELSDDSTTTGSDVEEHETAKDPSLSAMTSSYLIKKPLKQPPSILGTGERQATTDPSLTDFEEPYTLPADYLREKSYRDMHRTLKILLGLKAFRGVPIVVTTRHGLRQTNDEMFKAYIRAFQKYFAMCCSPGLANRIFIVHLTIQYELELRMRNVPLLLQSLRNPHRFKKQYGVHAFDYYSRLKMDVVMTVLRKQDISSSLLDIVLMLAAFGGYKLYGGRALIKLLLRLPSSGTTRTPISSSPVQQPNEKGNIATIGDQKDTAHLAEATSKAFTAIKKDSTEKDRTKSSSSILPNKTKLFRSLDIKTRDALEIERQLEKYSAFDIDSTLPTQQEDGAIERKVYRLLISVDVFLTQQNLELSDEIPHIHVSNSTQDVSLSSEQLTPSDVPSTLFNHFIQTLVKTVGRQGESTMVYYLLRGVFLLALQINPLLALKPITFMEALQFCRVNTGVNPDMSNNNIITQNLKSFFASHNITSLEDVWVKPIYSLFIVSSLAHLQHVDSLHLIHALATLGHAGNISLRLFSPPELVTLCLLTSERHKLGVVIEVSTLLSIASRNMTVLLIADMPTELRMKLPESPVLRHFATDVSAFPAQNAADDSSDYNQNEKSLPDKESGCCMSRVISFSITRTHLVKKAIISQMPLLILRENQRYYSINNSYFTKAAGYKVNILELEKQGKMYRGVRYMPLMATMEAFSAATLQTYLFITANLLPDTIFLTFDRFVELSAILYEQCVNYYNAFLHSCYKLLETIKLLSTGIYCQMFPPTIRDNIIAYKTNLTTLKNYLYPYYKRALVLVRNAACDCPATIARIYAGSLRKDSVASEEAFEMALFQHLKATGFDRLSIMQFNTSGGFADSMFGFANAGFDVITDTYLRDILDEVNYLFEDCESAFTGSQGTGSTPTMKSTVIKKTTGREYAEVLLAKRSTLPFNLSGLPSTFLGTCLDSFSPQWDAGTACHLTKYVFFANATMLQEILTLIIAISLGTRLCFIANLLLVPLAITAELHFITSSPLEYNERKDELEACKNEKGHYTLESLVDIIHWVDAAQSVAAFNLDLSKAFAQHKAIGFRNVIFENVTQLNVHTLGSQENEASVINTRTLINIFKVVGSRVSDSQTPIRINCLSISPSRPLHEYRYYIGLAQGTRFSNMVSSGIISFEIINSSILIEPKYSNINLCIKYLELLTPEALELQLVQTYDFAISHLQNVLTYLTSSFEKTEVMRGHRLVTSTLDLVKLLKRISEINSKFIIEKHGAKLREAIINPDMFIHLIDDEQNRLQESNSMTKLKANRIRQEIDELTYLLTTPTPTFNFELTMRICERSVAIANFRFQLEQDAVEQATKASFARYCARGLGAILIVCQKLIYIMPTLSNLFNNFFFKNFFIYFQEQLSTQQWKDVPLSHVLSHILLPYVNSRVHTLVPRTWAAPICSLLAIVFSSALSECPTDNLSLLKFILSPDLREKAIMVNPLCNPHDERYIRARELMGIAPLSFKASIATEFTWRNVAILHPFSDRVLSWLEYFSRNNFTFVCLVTSLDPYRMIIGHYMNKEAQRYTTVATDESSTETNQSKCLPLFTQENMALYSYADELPLPMDIQIPSYSNILQSLVFGLSLNQLQLREKFRLFTSINKLCAFEKEVSEHADRFNRAHSAYCKNQNLTPTLFYKPIIGIAWHIVLVCGYIPNIDNLGNRSHTYDPVRAIKPVRSSDIRYEQKMSSKSYADGIGSRTLVIFYEEGISIIDLVIDALERSLLDELALAPYVITSRPTEDDFRTKTVIVDASVDTKETIDLLILMYSRGWKVTSLLIVLIPVCTARFTGEEAIHRVVRRVGLSNDDTDASQVAAQHASAECINLSQSLAVFVSISCGAFYYLEGPRTLSESVIYLLTISLRIFRKHHLDISNFSPRIFKLYYSLLIQHAFLKGSQGLVYSDSYFLTAIMHLIGKNSEEILKKSSQTAEKYVLAARGSDEKSVQSAQACPIHTSEAYISAYSSLFSPLPATSSSVLVYLNIYYNRNVPKLVSGISCKWYADTGSINLFIDTSFNQASLALMLARAKLDQAQGRGDADDGDLEDILLDAAKNQGEESSEPLSSLSMSSIGSSISTYSSQNTHTGSESVSIAAQQMIDLREDAVLTENRLEITAAELTEVVPRERRLGNASLMAAAIRFLELPNKKGIAALEAMLETIFRYERQLLLKNTHKYALSIKDAEQLSQLTQEELASLETLKYQTFSMVPVANNDILCNRMYREIFSIGLSQEVIDFLGNKPSYKNILSDISIQQAEADLPRSLKTILCLSDGYVQCTRTATPYFRTAFTEKIPIIKLRSEMYWEINAEIYQHVLGNIMKWAMLFHQSGDGRRKTFILLANRPSAVQQYKIDAHNSLVLSVNATKRRKLEKKAREKVDPDMFIIKLTGLRLFNIAYDPIEDSIADVTPESALGYVQTYTFYAVLIDTEYCEYNNVYYNSTEFSMLMDLAKVGTDSQILGHDVSISAGENSLKNVEDDLNEFMDGASYCSSENNEPEQRFVSIPVTFGGAIRGVQLYLRNKTNMRPLDIALKGAYCSTGHLG